MKILILFLILIGCGYSTAEIELKAKEFCSNKEGIKGYSVRYGIQILHCNDKQFIFLDKL